MKNTDDKIISSLTIRITEKETGNCIGSGIIYYNEQLKESVYILTAAHCLFQDGEGFQTPLEEINIHFYNSKDDSYYSMTKIIDPKLVFKDTNKDVAVFVINKAELETLIGEIPKIFCVNQRLSFNNFITKGFPNATQGKELDVIFPTWKQEMTEVHKFQLQLNEDYNSWATEGFSGSGIFLEANNEIYLFGVFTRFRPEDVGKVIYCQYLDTINELLDSCYLSPISFSYLGEQGMTPAFFRQKTESAIVNLGPRFNEKLNFRLPIALKFDDLSKDITFKSRTFKIFDDWLTEKSYRTLTENEHVGEFEIKLDELRETVKQWLSSISFRANDPFDPDWIFLEVNTFNELVNDKIGDLYTLRRQKEEERKHIKKDYSYRPPYDSEIERLWEITKHNKEFLGRLEDDIDIKLATHPFLIIKGEAGCGKSHVLGDIATEKLKKDVPTLLLLGQLFSSTKSISSNILEHLDLKCTFTEFLTSINDIGDQINSRVLILIDAINESKTSELWKDGLAGFIKEISQYPFIGLVVTIRSTYFKSVIPESISKNQEITFITHEGFRGNEYAALKLFCDFFGLRQPTFPILAPEFTNPLFLQLVCIGVKDSPDKAFPLGFHGIKKVFDLYISALNNKLLIKTEYSNRTTLVRKAINKVASLCFEKERRLLNLAEAVELFDNEFPKFPNLLYDLIQENVFVKNMYYDYDDGIDYESIYFAYERFGDFYIAEEQLKLYTSKEKILLAFKKEGSFASLLDDYYNDGIIEAISVLLPEKFKVEIYEAFDWVIKEEKLIKSYREKSSTISNHFLKSLTWRSIESIDSEKLNHWLSGEDFLVDNDDWICKLLELSAVPGHPLNSDRLHHGLKKYTMAERDSFWQTHLLGFGGYDDYGSAYPIKRLIDWAWTKDISFSLDYETARLTAQSLSWFLASTNRTLRDRTTKAMVNLLENQPEALVSTLKAFRRTNDMYILERLYAVAYGCILRTTKKESISVIAKYTYSSIFKNGNPPRNILLRDYARNICEYAIYKKANARFDMALVCPPYKSEVPLFPVEKDMNKYKIEYNKKTEKIPHRHEFNKIHNSVVEGDFGYKIIDPSLHYFAPIKKGMDEEIKEFYRSLNRLEKKLFKIISQNIELIFLYRHEKHLMLAIYETAEKLEAKIKHYEDSQEKFLKPFSPQQRKWIETIGIPYISIKINLKHKNRLSFATRPIKYWIVERVFKLGYKKDWHGEFDARSSRYNDNHNNYVERIGKKYQWIAYYEILSIIADNFTMERDSGSQKTNFYKGAWQLYLRDIDPAFTKQNMSDDEAADELGFILNERKWWDEPKYLHWNVPSSQWSIQLEDLPTAKDVIVKKESNGVEWVHLEHFIEWRQPKKLGEDKYLSPNKRLWFMIQGYLVQKKDKKKIVSYLSDKNFFGRWMPENRDSFSRLINREKFWSPAYVDEGKDAKWSYIRDTNYKLIVATTSAKGNMEEDKSNANSNYNIPSQTLFDGLELQYASNDGDFIDSSANLVVTNINPGGVLIRKDKLVEFLAKNDLEIIWTILGEKISDLGGHKYDFGIPCGVFYLTNDAIKGEMIMHQRD